MTDLFVRNGGGIWFTVHGRDEDGREYQIADLGDCGEFSTVLEPHEAAYYARLFAQAEKLGRALAEICREIDKYPIRTRICDTNLHYMKMRAREELRTGNDDET